VGSLDHLAESALAGQADAVLTASIFQSGEHTVWEAKEHPTARRMVLRPVQGAP
jgi:cyclase